MTPVTPESQKEKPISEIQAILRKEVEAMAQEAGHSVLGSGPDSQGNYSDSRFSDKDRLEMLRRMLVHDEMLNQSEDEALKRFASSEEWLKAFAQNVQNMGESVGEPLCQFIESQFGLQIPRKDPNQVRFDNLMFFVSQSLTLPREEIEKELSYGRLPPEEENQRLEILYKKYSKE